MQTAEWDSERGQMVVRDMTPDELAEIDARAAAAAPIVPQQVTMRQARLALLASGKLEGVDAAIDLLPSPQKEAARIEWNYARDVERNSPMVSLLGQALEFDAETLDALFVDAAKL